jgi:hypothetical protein
MYFHEFRSFKTGILTIASILFTTLFANAQNFAPLDIPRLKGNQPEWVNAMYEQPINLYKVDSLKEIYYASHPFEKNEYTRYFKRLRQHHRLQMDESGNIKTLNSKDWQDINSNVSLKSQLPPGSEWDTYQLGNVLASQRCCFSAHVPLANQYLRV